MKRWNLIPMDATDVGALLIRAASEARAARGQVFIEADDRHLTIGATAGGIRVFEDNLHLSRK